jgi:hypothetical protein
MPLNLPTQAAVVRFKFGARGQRPPQLPPGRFLLAPAIDTPVRNSAGQIVVVLRNPAFDQDPGNPAGSLAPAGCPTNFGTDPNDPAGFSPMVDAGSAVCQMLSSYAAAACMHRGRYF